jgi:Holliday junction DNA helicase RuvA
LARDILSNIQPAQLAQALGQGDIRMLSAVPGIGKKTAERLVLELKEKVGKLDLSSVVVPEPRQMPEDDLLEDVVSALLNLGYKEPQVRKVLAGLNPGSDASLEGVLKQALKSLMR